MSFTWFADQPLKSREDVMQEIIAVAQELNMPDKRSACVIAGMTVSQEAGADPHNIGQRQFWCPSNPTNWPDSDSFPHDSNGDDGRSSGYFQQQPGPNGEPWWGSTAEMMTLHTACTTFMSRLRANGYDATNAQSANDSAQAVQQSGAPSAYAPWWGDVNSLYDHVIGGTPKPDFNEYPKWCNNNQNRIGTKIDLWLIHTEEGGSNADGLASFLISTQGTANPVSYHYTVSEDPNDHGVTVVDVVDTDLASWSVGNSNDRSINLCFAGSYAAWTRSQWLQQIKAIEAAAYLCVQDCIKYTIPMNVIPPPYSSDPPGIADHRYCTDYLKDGNTHQDAGDNFPWDLFSGYVQKWQAILTGRPAPAGPTPTPTPTPAPTNFNQPVDATKEIWDQLRLRWNCLGGHTLVEAVAQIRDKTCGTNDAGKTGVSP